MAGNFNELIRAFEQLQKFCDHMQASAHLIFASNSSEGQILRALSNWMEPFDTSISRSEKFIPLSTWLHEGKTFHRGVILYLKKWKTSSRNVCFFVLRPHLHNAFLNVPSKEFSLQSAGLGWKTVVFSSKGSFVDIKEKLESVYPKLKDGAGFELLRMGSPNAKLALINSPAGRYSVPFLRYAAGLGQTWPLWGSTCMKKRRRHIVRKRLQKFCMTLCWLLVCVCGKDNDGRVTLCPDSLEFSEPLCSLLCVSMRSFASSSTLLFFYKNIEAEICEILRIF